MISCSVFEAIVVRCIALVAALIVCRAVFVMMVFCAVHTNGIVFAIRGCVPEEGTVRALSHIYVILDWECSESDLDSHV